MKKIPTVFERDWEGDRSRVLDSIHEGCEWVLAGEGDATRKLDGSCCMVRDNHLYKRRELKEGQIAPPDFEEIGFDQETKKTVGWIPVGKGKEDRWHHEAWSEADHWPDGTYELIGPNVQSNTLNPEGLAKHMLAPHALCQRLNPPRSFDGLSAWLAGQDIEGIVFHHPDGRMAKIKLRDFGLKRQKNFITRGENG